MLRFDSMKDSPGKGQPRHLLLHGQRPSEDSRSIPAKFSIEYLFVYLFQSHRLLGQPRLYAVLTLHYSIPSLLPEYPDLYHPSLFVRQTTFNLKNHANRAVLSA